jgi:hypothetical protein
MSNWQRHSSAAGGLRVAKKERNFLIKIFVSKHLHKCLDAKGSPTVYFSSPVSLKGENRYWQAFPDNDIIELPVTKGLGIVNQAV